MRRLMRRQRQPASRAWSWVGVTEEGSERRARRAEEGREGGKRGGWGKGKGREVGAMGVL
jgi:hypothetical protein